MKNAAYLPIDKVHARGAITALILGLVLVGCQWLPKPADRPLDQVLGARLDESIRVLATPASTERQRAQAGADYRDLVASHLSLLLKEAGRPDREQALAPTLIPAETGLSGVVAGVLAPADFADITPVQRPRATEPGLHRTGLGLPLVGRTFPGGANAPLAGFHVPLTLLALPRAPTMGCCDAALVDPESIRSVNTAHGELAVAMDLETPLDATRATGPRFSDGLANMLRADRFAGPPRIGFLQPYDPAKTPVVLVHGLMSTPRMWAPLVKALLADEQIRAHYQFWFFYYPTSKPIPISALRLREALDGVARVHPLHKPMILIGHSMGGILARAQVSRIGVPEAQRISPEIASLPEANPVRRALVFEPRADVSRVGFMFTPHRGSRFAINRIGTLGIRLTRLPQRLIGELANYAHLVPDAIDGRLPTSIHGLSPHSQFLQLMDHTRPTVPAHSIIGVRRGGPTSTGSDGVVSYWSAHLDTAESEVVVPAGHSGVAHPKSIAELRRILLQALDTERRTSNTAPSVQSENDRT